MEKGVKLKLLKDEISASAYYDRTKKAIVFAKSNTHISIQNLQHELFHAYQDKIYPNLGLYSKGKKGFINIEYEVQFMQVLLFIVAPKEKEDGNEWSRFEKTIPVSDSHLEEFNKWVKLITLDYKDYPFMDLNLEKYYKFMKYFGEEKPAYNSAINYQLKPLALINFIEQLQK